MTRLSVNINKIATLRNARGGNVPDVQKAAVDCQKFGAQGITVHPRPDERHIRYKDVELIKPLITTEFNIEGYPSGQFLDLCTRIGPDQVTLVPDPPDAITSSAGWNTKENKDFLIDVIQRLKEANIRTSIFVDTDKMNIEGAAEVGTDRIELYTEPYAAMFPENPEAAVIPFVKAATAAQDLGLDINAGHDLSLENLKFFVDKIPWMKEVSIGHALVADALYYGLENVVRMYLRALSV
jgi:pyridoxine 5-phosphate synthase